MKNRPVRIAEFCVAPSHTVRDTIALIDRNVRGIALVVDTDGRLLSTVTDGDVRRAILAGVGLTAPVSELVEVKQRVTGLSAPLTAPEGCTEEELIEMMRAHSVRHILIVDETGAPVDLIGVDDLLPEQIPELRALIMAGGSGQRLRPLTLDTPKPMLPVGDKPVLELILDQLRGSGVRHTQISTFYRKEKIQAYFRDGAGFGLRINYINENEPLGTAGALRMLSGDWTEPLLVMNGDILTRLSFRDMCTFHREHDAIMTMAVRSYEIEVPYGVVDAEGPVVRRVVEKPRQSFFVNAGVYLLSPEVRKFFPDRQRFDMTDLVAALLDAGQRVVSFPIHEYWLDIGHHHDYERAQEDSRRGLLAV